MRTITLTDSQKSLVNTLPQQYINLNLGDTCNVVLAYILSKAQDNIAMLTNGEIMENTGFSKPTLTKVFKQITDNGIIERVVGKKGCPSIYRFVNPDAINVEAKKDTDTPPPINYSQLYELSKMGDGLPLNIFVELMHMISINPRKKFLTYSQIAQFTGRKLRTIALYIPYLKEQGYIPSEWMDRIGEKR